MSATLSDPQSQGRHQLVALPHLLSHARGLVDRLEIWRVPGAQGLLGLEIMQGLEDLLETIWRVHGCLLPDSRPQLLKDTDHRCRSPQSQESLEEKVKQGTTQRSVLLFHKRLFRNCTVKVILPFLSQHQSPLFYRVRSHACRSSSGRSWTNCAHAERTAGFLSLEWMDGGIRVWFPVESRRRPTPSSIRKSATARTMSAENGDIASILNHTREQRVFGRAALEQ